MHPPPLWLPLAPPWRVRLRLPPSVPHCSLISLPRVVGLRAAGSSVAGLPLPRSFGASLLHPPLPPWRPSLFQPHHRTHYPLLQSFQLPLGREMPRGSATVPLKWILMGRRAPRPTRPRSFAASRPCLMVLTGVNSRSNMLLPTRRLLNSLHSSWIAAERPAACPQYRAILHWKGVGRHPVAPPVLGWGWGHHHLRRSPCHEVHLQRWVRLPPQQFHPHLSGQTPIVGGSQPPYPPCTPRASSSYNNSSSRRPAAAEAAA